MRRLPQELAGLSHRFLLPRDRHQHTFCSHSRERYPLSLRPADGARHRRGLFDAQGGCARQVPFPTFERIDGRFDHFRAVFGGRCNPGGKILPRIVEPSTLMVVCLISSASFIMRR